MQRKFCKKQKQQKLGLLLFLNYEFIYSAFQKVRKT